MGLSKRRWKRELKKEWQQRYPLEAPKKKEEFLRDLPYPQASPWEAVLVQIAYIRKSVWVISFFLVLAVLLPEAGMLENGIGGKGAFRSGMPAAGGDYGGLWGMSAVMPALAVLAVIETFRSSVYGMAEMEMAAKHNLPQVLLVRLGVIGSVDFGLALLGAALASPRAGIGWLRAAVYLFVPWLCTCVLSLQAQKYRRGREAAWYGIFCAAAVSMAGIYGIGQKEILYKNASFPLWIVAFVLLSAVCAKQARGIWRKAEEWKGAGTWNLS